jgi:hypothetical protein
VKFAPGEVLLRRHWRAGRISALFVARVAADDERGLRLWLPEGSPCFRLAIEDRRANGELSIDQMPGARLIRSVWTDTDAMVWMPPDRPYSVWWFWRDGGFAGWKANLEEPHVRWSDRGCAGVDTADHALEVVVTPDRSWRWKGEDEFEARIGHPLYWTAAQANQIRAAGQRLARAAEAAEFPFDGAWTGFRPDASWTVPGLPAGHDRPRALA